MAEWVRWALKIHNDQKLPPLHLNPSFLNPRIRPQWATLVLDIPRQLPTRHFNTRTRVEIEGKHLQ